MFRRVLIWVMALTLLSCSLLPSFAEMTFSDSEEAVSEEDVSADEDFDGESGEFPTLQLGDRDDDSVENVLSLQTRLIELGFLGDDEADGAFGQKTEEAVKYFQRLNGLEATGIANRETQELLYSSASALTTPPPVALAMESEGVRIQTVLSLWGFLYKKIDGEIGNATKTGITYFKQYLSDNDLLPEATPEPTPTPVPTAAPGELPIVVDVQKITPSPSPTPFVADGEVTDLLMSYIDGLEEFDVYHQDVQYGDENMDVYRVQARLKQLNYLYRRPDQKFGLNTQRALMYFQRKNNLAETGIADEATQRALFSEDAVESEEYVFPYKIYVDISDQTIYIYRWDGEAYSIPDRTMICSTGKKDTPTPTGTFQAYGQLDLEDGEWWWFTTYKCYAKYAYGIVGGILFHSVTYTRDKKPLGDEENLGRRASHGCIRLTVDDAKWIYDNCPYGTTVVIQD